MNILVTLDANYIRPLSVMLHSLVRADDCPKFDLYIAHSSLTDENIDSIFRGIDRSRFNVHSIRLSHELNADAPTEDRITQRDILSTHRARISARRARQNTLYRPGHADSQLHIRSL